MPTRKLQGKVRGSLWLAVHFHVGPVMARVVLFGDSKWGVDTSVLQTVDHLYTLNKFVISAFHQIYKITTVHIFKLGNCYSGQWGMEF